MDGGTADKPEPSKPVQSKLDMRVQVLCRKGEGDMRVQVHVSGQVER